ncbi:MAG: AMP-dependent synthetase [Betaproteobacteria bacterium]|nr:AMP-dependent synthetase [Betaproteobacteria bacterium]
MPFTTLAEMVAQQRADATAITAPAGDAPCTALTYGALGALIDRTVSTLNGQGIGRGDRVAIVLPNCPEMATAFVAVASACTSAPLNMAYRADEFEFYLSDLKAKALIVAEGAQTPAREVAAKLGVRVLELRPMPGRGAGDFDLVAQGVGATLAASSGAAQADDVALILHTSGTTSRPKIVPLTHRNVCASARNISRTLALTERDVELHIMPLFHIHGLIAGVLAPMAVGSQIFVTPGFNALKFFAWMKECKPTWYTAVPTMHQTILARAGGNMDTIQANPLRFIRSSSSSIPPQVIAELEKVFNCPLIESYGMTEASHQMASNPLPPAKRIPGSVGIAAGPEVAIMDNDGKLLPPGSIGEVVIRGENVTLGYENNPKANAEAYTNGWFRTGDQGQMDADGYLTLTGRLKEIINRGGEKISPREVDEVIMDHPSVAQVVCFAIPHDKLGEEVGAAVVLKEGQAASDQEIRQFVAGRLADFKVPRKVLILPEIPKGATGKLQRIGLAQKLGLA